jgi:hypothetical protein
MLLYSYEFEFENLYNGGVGLKIYIYIYIFKQNSELHYFMCMICAQIFHLHNIRAMEGKMVFVTIGKLELRRAKK